MAAFFTVTKKRTIITIIIAIIIITAERAVCSSQKEDSRLVFMYKTVKVIKINSFQAPPVMT